MSKSKTESSQSAPKKFIYNPVVHYCKSLGLTIPKRKTELAFQVFYNANETSNLLSQTGYHLDFMHRPGIRSFKLWIINEVK